MIRALYSAASGMRAQEMNVDNIANNLANANTVGYKTRRAQFQDLMYQSVLQPGRFGTADRRAGGHAIGPWHQADFQ
jgi:flagellar basal-body rod protein FlgG